MSFKLYALRCPMLDRCPLLINTLVEGAAAQPAPGQHRKFLQKKAVSPEDLAVYKQRTQLAGNKLVSRLSYKDTPRDLNYPSRADLTRLKQRGSLPRLHHFPEDLPERMRKPMARTLRHVERIGVASGGRHDTKASEIGYHRVSFHPDDDEQHGAPAHKRSRIAMNHLVKHYPDVPFDHYQDELGDGRYTHHIEVAHRDIPAAIRHLKEWDALLALGASATGA